MFVPRVATTQTRGDASSTGRFGPRTSRQARNERDGDHEREIVRENLTDLAAPRRIAWDFGKIPLFPPDQTSRSQPLYPLPGIIQPKLTVGAVNDPLEHEADRVADQVMRPRHQVEAPSLVGSSDPLAEGADRAASASIRGRPSGPLVPVIVRETLSSPGRPFDAASRTFFEARFQRDFSAVRLHADELAADSAAAIGARAYTVGEHIVLGSGGAEPSVLGHELAHVLQQRAARMPWVQRQPAAGQAPPAPRQDFVFIMGRDPKGTSNPFYRYAKRYFRAHLAAATFVEDKRSLTDLLSWISANVSKPIGNLYIVSHGNEDGTLGFGLDASDTDRRLTVIELRNALHPSGGGSSKLASVASVVDAQTRIHIKGCDIGRTQEMVELIDEAFGGAGTVTAPTHEQEYSTDPTLGERARGEAHDERIAAFTAGLPALPPEPAPIDRRLKATHASTPSRSTMLP
jgi:Domain of unknown function (DUF4157)